MYCSEHGTLNYCPECIAEEEAEHRRYLIWSNEHAAWWAPDRRGYTTIIGNAGRYTANEAMRICLDANRHLNPDDTPYEVLIRAPEHEQ